MAQPDVIAAGRTALLKRFSWVDGHADVWRAFEDPDAFRDVVAALATLASHGLPTKVVSVESRGFILGGAVAHELGAGFQAIRKPGSLFPGPKQIITTDRDYRGKEYELRLRSTLTPADRVVYVDDWIEVGAQGRATRSLVERSGAEWLGTVVLVDDTDHDTRQDVGPLRSLVRSGELGESA